MTYCETNKFNQLYKTLSLFVSPCLDQVPVWILIKLRPAHLSTYILRTLLQTDLPIWISLVISFGLQFFRKSTSKQYDSIKVFFMLALLRRASFWPPSMVYISVLCFLISSSQQYIHIQIQMNQLIIFIEKFSPCWDLNLGPPEYLAD